ncbi:MAG: hypothetical protein HY064_03710 [Bacteroidetes bacterium]|nr:hypothetical protein [Bacteroidota bacterium]
MSNLTLNEYPVFENNQVLTSSSLNELATYLDQQTRLTRTKLIGIGIACGFKQNYDIVANKLTITGGSGITTLGFLIAEGPCEFTKYRAYTLPTTDQYTPYINTATNSQVTLWELLRSDYMPAPNETVVNLDFTFVNGTSPGDKKIVMLFLEEVDISNDACLGKSCDTAGFIRHFTVRKLLVSVNDMQIILDNTGNFDLTFVGKFDLPDILSQRPLFDPNLNNSKDYFAFSQDFRNATASVYKQSTNPLDLSDLFNILRQSFVVFKPILENIYGNTNPFDPNQIPNLNIWNEIMNGTNSLTDGPSYFGIQYFYDFMRDLIRAYDEFRDAAFELMSDCCFDSGLFPMHLVLGEAIPIDPDKPSVYRDDFVGIPLTPEQHFAKDTLVCYFNRMVLMVRKFNVARIHNPMSALPPTFITPSDETLAPLSKSSIPYYYDIDANDSQIGGKLEKFWNFENIRRNKDRAGEYPVVAYGNQSNNQTAPIDPIQTPNFYDLAKFNFYRIEGCLGKDKNAVLTDLNNKKAAFDFPFNAIAVRLQGTSDPDDILARCNFNDLRSQYVAYRNELTCKIQQLFDHFFEKTQDNIAILGTPKDATPLASAPGTPDATPGRSSGSSVRVKELPTWIKSLLLDTNVPIEQGNSSATFMPAYYALPGQSLPRFIPPIQYSPSSLKTIGAQFNQTYLPALASRLSHLGLLLPPTLDDFNYGADNIGDTDNSFIGSYIDAVALCNTIKALLNEIADQVTHSSVNIFTPEQYFMFGQWMNEQMYFLNEFITDCSYRNVEAVFYELQYRIGYLQTNDPTVFSNFITRNPGIQHKSGVEPGGTFVIVYPGKSLNFSIKIQEQLTAMIELIKTKEIFRSDLRAVQGRSVDQNNQLAIVDSELCDLYQAQVQQPIRPFTLGSAVSAIPVEMISIGANQVIADFSLPYLTNCECECDDIPAPTAAQLGIPAIAIPSFYEFFLGDYAYAKNFITNTFGCTTPAQLTIDIRPNINYTTINQKESIIILKFVVNGNILARNINTASRSTAISIQTAKGGTVLINSATSDYEVFIYTPPKDFLGVDKFQYVFEVYDRSTNNILLHSNKAEVTIVVTTRCKPVASISNTSTTEGFPIGVL